jgi:hypothetical protein
VLVKKFYQHTIYVLLATSGAASGPNWRVRSRRQTSPIMSTNPRPTVRHESRETNQLTSNYAGGVIVRGSNQEGRHLRGGGGRLLGRLPGRLLAGRVDRNDGRRVKPRAAPTGGHCTLHGAVRVVIYHMDHVALKHPHASSSSWDFARRRGFHILMQLGDDSWCHVILNTSILLAHFTT